MDINYKLTDICKTVEYVSSSFTIIPVESIIQDSGTNRLRLYSALFELEQNGFGGVIERDEFGVPLIVGKRNDFSTNSYYTLI